MTHHWQINSDDKNIKNLKNSKVYLKIGEEFTNQLMNAYLQKYLRYIDISILREGVKYRHQIVFNPKGFEIVDMKRSINVKQQNVFVT